MSERVAELVGLLDKGERGLVELYGALERALNHDVKILGRTGNAALIVAGLLENYYTCLETTLLRISQAFENHLSPDRWHTDLLERMSAAVPGVRIAAISDDNFPRLLDLMKFRHFRRYYYEIEYDWDRLDFLVKKLKQAHPRVREDLARFREFLVELQDGPSS